ncbi:3-oxoacyl-ACP reductase [Kocuria varians]|uniref:3-oxoacyl-ACP reductase n=1 Tax=Kocuria varians TaxID=1272 RepID=UPI00083849BF|nr:3-oxoacyl-ACP reductase [Kocuria varians]
MRIENTIVLVTGGARGLGEHLSRAFAREGARVVVNYHSSEERAAALVAEFGKHRALAVRADVTDALVEFSFNGDARPTLETLTAQNLTQQFEGAVVGALNVMQAVAPGMAEVGKGRIINIGANLFQNPVVPYHDYTAAKAALLSLTRTAAKDLGPQGITVNMISGGLLRTTDASAATPDEVFDVIAAGTPLGRVTTPEEFADTTLFFASDWSRGVTGQNLVVDGGLVVD